MGWVSWPLYIFVFLASFSACWWPNIWPKMGFPELFEKNCLPNSFHAWHLSLWGESLYPYTFSCSYPHFQPAGGQIFGRKWGFRNFLKKTIGSIYFIPGIYSYGVSFFTPVHFRVPSLIFGPLVAKCLAENGVSGIFWKKLLAQFISYLAFTLMGWVSWPLCIFVFLASFSAPWWPNIWPKMGFPELFEKTIGSIHFIPGIYPYGVSLLTLIHFRVPSIIFGRLVAKYLAENGVSWIFLKNYWFHSLHTWHLPFGGYLDEDISGWGG